MTMKTVLGPTALVNDALAPVVGAVHSVQPAARTFQAVLFGANSTAQVAIDVSLDGTHFLPLATLTLTTTAGAQQATDGFNSAAPWRYVRARVVSLTAGACVNVLMGV